MPSTSTPTSKQPLGWDEDGPLPHICADTPVLVSIDPERDVMLYKCRTCGYIIETSLEYHEAHYPNAT